MLHAFSTIVFSFWGDGGYIFVYLYSLLTAAIFLPTVVVSYLYFPFPSPHW